MNDFDGLVAVVTGGASGIGAATAARLFQRGAQVVVLDRAEAREGAHRYVRCDITEDADISDAFDAVSEEFGRLDLLVNNAGIGAVGDETSNARPEWHTVLDVNVVSMARVSALALPLLRRSSAAAIVNVSSVVALVGVRNRVLYAASKGAIMSMTLAMAADHLSDNIRVNAVAPGTADTPWVARLLEAAVDPAAELAALRARQPLGRFVRAEEIAEAVCYLASPLAGSTTGTVLSVDGGMANLRV